MKLPRLVALTPGDLERARFQRFLGRLAAAAGAGLPGLLVREPRPGDREWLELLEGVRAICDAHGVWLAVHDRAHLAAHVGADALHLGFRSLPPAAARTALRPGAMLGLSTHAGDAPAAWADADYLFHGPVRRTPSKEGLREPVGFDGLARSTALARRPVLAIGGLRPEDVAAALAAGAHGVAVLGGILATGDPAPATRAYLDALSAAA